MKDNINNNSSNNTTKICNNFMSCIPRAPVTALLRQEHRRINCILESPPTNPISTSDLPTSKLYRLR